MRLTDTTAQFSTAFYQTNVVHLVPSSFSYYLFWKNTLGG